MMPLPSRPTDPGIPVLTQRIDVVAGVLASGDQPPASGQAPELAIANPLPVLTDVAAWEDDIPTLEIISTPSLPSEHAAAVASEPGPTPVPLDAQAAVLRAALQAELEQAMQIALEDAIQGIRTRMDSELPGIVARVLDRVRPG